MGDGLGKKGYIRVSHLVYIIIIAIIVLSFFLVIAFGGTENASTTIGTASTVSSLILSVIAIVMTLIDVAGQRQSMMDLKETADKLRESNESADVLIQELTAKMVDLQDMKEQMVEAVKESDEWRKDLVTKLENIKQKGNIEELKDVIENVSENKIANIDNILQYNYMNPYLEHIRGHKYAVETDIFSKTVKYLRNNYTLKIEFKRRDFLDILQKDLILSRSMATKIMNDLLNKNYIKFFPTPTGEEITFTEKLFK
jgi:hypothetical protein